MRLGKTNTVMSILLLSSVCVGLVIFYLNRPRRTLVRHLGIDDASGVAVIHYRSRDIVAGDPRYEWCVEHDPEWINKLIASVPLIPAVSPSEEFHECDQLMRRHVGAGGILHYFGHVGGCQVHVAVSTNRNVSCIVLQAY